MYGIFYSFLNDSCIVVKKVVIWVECWYLPFLPFAKVWVQILLYSVNDAFSFSFLFFLAHSVIVPLSEGWELGL